MKRLFILLLLPLVLSAAKVDYLRWDNGMTFLSFLAKHDLPSRPLYWNLDHDDQTLTEEIYAGIGYQILRDENQTIEQVLIPVSDELQLHIYQDANNSYTFEAIPVLYSSERLSFTTTIQNNPSSAIYNATHSKRAMSAFISGFRKSINFSLHVQKDDPIVMIYDQKFRFGKPFSMPRLQLAKIKLHGKWHGVYLGADERYYEVKGHEVEDFYLAILSVERVSAQVLHVDVGTRFFTSTVPTLALIMLRAEERLFVLLEQVRSLNFVAAEAMEI